MRKHLVIFSFIFLNAFIHAQELNCNITINTDQIQGTAEKQIFEQMRKSIFEFMNNTKWTTDIFAANERIDCSILIIIKQKLNTDEYSASIQVQSTRPVYNSSYRTPVLNVEDENFEFKYQQFTTLDFNLNSFTNNITQVLAFYAYVILAVDYDTFSLLGGTAYWQKAQTIVNNAQSAGEKGWHSNDGNKNRYWLIENTLQPVFQPIRECMYEYNFKGLDIMYEKTSDGRAVILKSLDLLKKVYTARPASFNMQLFFNAKTDELINIFKGAQPDEKEKAREVLMGVDPANTTKYLRIGS